jgi:hypothetical protein
VGLLLVLSPSLPPPPPPPPPPGLPAAYGGLALALVVVR